MTRNRRKFEPSFKQEVARMVVDEGQTIKDVSESMQVGETAVRSWVDLYKQHKLGKVVSGMPLSEHQQRIRDLERQLRDLQEENLIS